MHYIAQRNFLFYIHIFQTHGKLKSSFRKHLSQDRTVTTTEAAKIYDTFVFQIFLQNKISLILFTLFSFHKNCICITWIYTYILTIPIRYLHIKCIYIYIYETIGKLVHLKLMNLKRFYLKSIVFVIVNVNISII